jgi:excinuclease ABC subunit C
MLRYGGEETGERLFPGFGPSRFKAVRKARTQQIRKRRLRRSMRRVLREHCPAAPGVYGMIDADDQLIYVGKAKSLRHRLLSYFQASAAESKAHVIITQTVRLIWEPAHHEFDALVRELELIRRWRPRFNVEGLPGRRQRAYLCLGRAPGAYAYLATRPGAGVEHAYGPVSAGAKMQRAVERLNTFFKLRDCPERVSMHFADQRQLFDAALDPQCLRYALGTCLGPCAALCTSREYGRAVERARKLIDGSDLRTVATLEREMRAAAERRQFERAAMLRDLVNDLQFLRGQVDRIQRIRRPGCLVYALADHRGRGRWFVLHHGYPAQVCLAPQNAERARRCEALLDAIDEQPESTPEEQLSFMLLVASWFRRRPVELERLMSLDEARAVCTRLLESEEPSSTRAD